MSFIKNLIDTKRFEVTAVLLGLSWLTNPLFIAIFLALIVYYHIIDRRSKKRYSVIFPPFKYR